MSGLAYYREHRATMEPEIRAALQRHGVSGRSSSRVAIMAARAGTPQFQKSMGAIKAQIDVELAEKSLSDYGEELYTDVESTAPHATASRRSKNISAGYRHVDETEATPEARKQSEKALALQILDDAMTNFGSSAIRSKMEGFRTLLEGYAGGDPAGFVMRQLEELADSVRDPIVEGTSVVHTGTSAITVPNIVGYNETEASINLRNLASTLAPWKEQGRPGRSPAASSSPDVSRGGVDPSDIPARVAANMERIARDRAELERSSEEYRRKRDEAAADPDDPRNWLGSAPGRAAATGRRYRGRDYSIGEMQTLPEQDYWDIMENTPGDTWRPGKKNAGTAVVLENVGANGQLYSPTADRLGSE